MKTKTKLLLFVAMVGAFSLIGVKSTYAITAPIPTTSTLSVISTDGTKNFSVADTGSNPWYDVINDSGTIIVDGSSGGAGCDPTAMRALRNTNNIIVTQIEYRSSLTPITGQLGVYINVSNGTTPAPSIAKEDDTHTHMYSAGNTGSGWWGILTVDNDGTYRFRCDKDTSQIQLSPTDWYAAWIAGNISGDMGKGYVYYNTYTITYPSDYDGGDLPTEPETPPEDSPFVPNWYISTILDFKGSFHDTHFNTFDGNPFLCDGGLAPVLTWEIWRDTDTPVMITSGIQNATAQIDYDFGKADIDRDYYIIGQYDCGDDDPLQFSEYGVANFTVNRAGTQAINLFDACVSETFPFIHPDACLNNMYTVINLLYFGEVQFPSFTYNPACQNLVTMDDWLNLPSGYQVCPQIPSTVRNITTPFVAFMLGLITLKFIQRRSGDFNG